jgi:hypothetical protein
MPADAWLRSQTSNRFRDEEFRPIRHEPPPPLEEVSLR